MKENKYDDIQFFEQYSKMNRSRIGLQGAGEWHALQKMLPSFNEKKILDLGCGFGWHCRYAIESGATSVTGIDISEKMLEKAREINQLEGIHYIREAIEDLHFPFNHFDLVLSSLTIHYIESFEFLCKNVYDWLKPKSSFIFSVEHPVYTAEGNQNWIYDEKDRIQCWPVDSYFSEGRRETVFLGEKVIKYHRTLTTYLQSLLRCGFKIKEVIEPQPSEKMLNELAEMKDELRRPMMLLVSAEK